MITAIAMVPLMGALALGVDYAQMSRERQAALSALDAAGIATARYISEGADDAQAIAYAQQFFEANLGPVDPADTNLEVTPPNQNITGGGTLKLRVAVAYHPYFLPTFHYLLGIGTSPDTLTFRASSEVRLKNTLEVALVLDNSGSMDDQGSGARKKRIDLLKDAAKELVETISKEAAQMKQIQKPVQFGLVPFAGAVNVGPSHAGDSWMDTDGLSPVHHENFDWSSMTGNKRVEKSGGVYVKKGSGWGSEEGQIVTRFTLFDSIMRKNGSTAKHATHWQGCVEMRPYPYALDDTAPSTARPATLFVPMFAPDETDRTDGGWTSRPANNNWWPDDTTSTNDAKRQAYMPKYFKVQDVSALGDGEGPNAGCTTKPITPLTDVSTAAGVETVKDAIDAMQPLGATNVTEGISWGWHVVSSGAPFTQGRRESEKGNDKVVIVLTDGANTYYTPDSVSANSYSGSGWRSGGNDLAGNKSIYSNYGYAGKNYDGTGKSRLYMGLSSDSGVNTSRFDNANFTNAMADHMSQVCENAKAAGLVVMTVALDLNSRNTTEAEQIAALKKCASDSRIRRDPDEPSKPAKLFWNATGSSLNDDFKAIGDELSNLRIVG